MISVAVKGYGLVIWQEPDEWRVYTMSARNGTSLASRVDDLLRDASPLGATAVRRALLTITGSVLLADTAFPECDGDCGGACDEGDGALN